MAETEATQLQASRGALSLDGAAEMSAGLATVHRAAAEKALDERGGGTVS